MSSSPAPRRSRLPWILLAVFVVIGLVIAAVAFFGNHGATTAAKPSSQTSTSPSAVSDPAPTGCLGGKSLDAAMLLTAQKAAPRTTNGAIEMAAAFTRWIQRYPYPTAADAYEVEKSVLTKKSFTDDLPSYLAAEPDLSGGIVAKGTNYYMSTIPGVWHLESGAADQVVASIGTGYVIEGTLSTTLRSSITVTLDWQDGGWKVADASGTRTTQNLYAIGTPFTGGC
jgi:hypothetical protein